MDLKNVSAASRPLDFSFKTNIAIAALSVLVFIAILTYAMLGLDYAFWQAVLAGLGAAFSTFAAWALARELDPDHQYAAFWGSAAAIAAAMYSHIFHPRYILLLLVILQFRILNRTAGPAAKLWDSLLIFGISVWLAFADLWIVAPLSALLFWMDYKLPERRRRHKWFAVAMAAAGMIAFVVSPDPPEATILQSPEAILLGTLAVLFVAVIFTTPHPKSKADLTGRPLLLSRLRATQGFALATLTLAALWMEAGAFYELIPLWSAIAGLILHRIFLLTKKQPAYHAGRK